MQETGPVYRPSSWARDNIPCIPVAIRHTLVELPLCRLCL